MSAERLVLAAAALGAAALLAATPVAATTPAPSAPEARVAVVLQPEGCPPKHTVDLCEGIRRAARRTGVRPRVVAPTYRENIGDFLLNLTIRSGWVCEMDHISRRSIFVACR